MDIRTLNADEISAKVKTVYNSSALILLYKDARVDMTLLDETFGASNWQRHHKEIKGNIYCNISVWDEEKKCWVEKEDVGTESMAEAEKGESSDSFKRAGTNWGIGRELYTVPKIVIKLESGEFKDKKVFTSFYVSHIGYRNRAISELTIIDGNGKVRFDWKENNPKGNGIPAEEKKDVLESYRVDLEARIQNSDLPKERKENAIKGLPTYNKKILDNISKMLDKEGA